MPRHANRPTADDVLDEVLVVQGQLGDEAAFSRLVRRWQGRFLRRAYQIVANKSRDWVRKQEARRRATRRVEARPAPAAPAPDASLIERVRRGLTELDPARRSVLRWFYLEGMSVAEIAEALDIPAGTVKSRLFHARDALRARLEET